MYSIPRNLLLLACLLSAFPYSLPALGADSKERADTDCVPFGRWTVPGGASISEADVVARAARRSVVLLGEIHDNPDHHRWQLQTLAALHAVRPDMVIGFEMFPRRVQKALDQWVAGALSESQFLSASEWGTVWSTDASLYLPLFHFARMNRIPMVALNIDTSLRRAVAKKGLSGVPENEREGITAPAAPSSAYLDYLLPIYAEHERDGKKKGEALKDDPDFRRFVEAQQLWDRAMAQAIHSAADQPGEAARCGNHGIRPYQTWLRRTPSIEGSQGYRGRYLAALDAGRLLWATGWRNSRRGLRQRLGGGRYERATAAAAGHPL